MYAYIIGKPLEYRNTHTLFSKHIHMRQVEHPSLLAGPALQLLRRRLKGALDGLRRSGGWKAQVGGWLHGWVDGCVGVCLFDFVFFFLGGGGGKHPKSTNKHDAHNQPIKTKKKVLATLDAGTSEWVLSCGAAAGDGDGLTEEEREVLSLASTSTRGKKGGGAVDMDVCVCVCVSACREAGVGG